jgi:hypothetical protein
VARQCTAHRPEQETAKRSAIRCTLGVLSVRRTCSTVLPNKRD